MSCRGFEPVCTNNELREYFSAKGLTYDSIDEGDMRMKPTDIFTNHPAPRFKPPCHNGDPCHVAAPRGARTGTQGLKNHVERSRIPDGLCNHIVQICEDGMNYKKFFEKAGD